MVERTQKYKSVVRTKKMMVSMDEDMACVEIGQIKALIAEKQWWIYMLKVETQGLAVVES